MADSLQPRPSTKSAYFTASSIRQWSLPVLMFRLATSTPEALVARKLGQEGLVEGSQRHAAVVVPHEACGQHVSGAGHAASCHSGNQVPKPRSRARRKISGATAMSS